MRLLPPRGWGACAILAFAVGHADPASYRTPPPVVTESLMQPMAPMVSLSPTRRWLLIAHRSAMPNIAQLAAGTVDLGGVSINPATGGVPSVFPLAVQSMDIVGTADTVSRPVEFPQGESGLPLWSPDGTQFLFWHAAPYGFELWIGDAKAASTRAVTGAQLNVTKSLEKVPCVWIHDNRHVICQLRVTDRGDAPIQAISSAHPEIQESSGIETHVRLYGGRIRTTKDQGQYEYFRSAQATLIDVQSGEREAIAEPTIYADLNPSPDGRYLLMIRVVPPYSSLLEETNFAKEVVVLDLQRRISRVIARLQMNWPGASARQFHSTGGPRNYAWRPDAPASLVYTETLDRTDAGSRHVLDRIAMIEAPFDGIPKELFRSEHRITSANAGGYGTAGDLLWLKHGRAWVDEFDLRSGRKRAWLIDADRPAASAELIRDWTGDNRYVQPDSPLTYSVGREERFLVQDGDWIYFTGQGASTDLRPFLDEFNLRTHRVRRLFESSPNRYQEIVGIVAAGRRSILRSESEQEPPAHYFYDLATHERRQIEKAADVPDGLSKIRIEHLHYDREDGVRLGATLYLPANYNDGHRLPLILYAYPLNFGNAVEANASRTNDAEYPWVKWVNLELAVRLLVSQGYAVLDNASMPIVGGNDTALEQMVSNAKAAIDELLRRGIADRSRIGIVGHSFGGLMVGILMAHTDLFAAGVAIDGAYNLTLSPAGFALEDRTLWQAPRVYAQLSSLGSAADITAPLLLIHGQNDDNSAAKPEQSEQMYEALAGLGKTARLVILPHEGHAPRSRESCLHVAWEILTWFDRYVRRADNE